MSNKTRKRLWPVSLVMAVAVVGVLAAFLALGTSPGNTEAHSGATGPTHCDDLGTIGKIAHDEDPQNDHDCATGPSGPPNQAPTVTMPVMNPITIEGLMVEVDGVMVKSTATVTGVTGYFSDPDDDALTFTAGSSDTSVATGMLDDGDLVITAQDVGEATITVTATDPAGATAMSTVMVSVRLSPAERYTIAPRRYEFDAPATQQVTFTVSAVDADGSPLDEDATVNLLMTQYPAASSTAPLVTRVIGLDSSLDSDITDDNVLQGLLTVRATDPDGQRGFTVYFQCSAPDERVDIRMLDETPELVGIATISCKAPDVVVPDDQVTGKDCYSVTGHVDQMRDDRDHPDATMEDQYDAANYMRDSNGNIVRRITEVSRLELSPEPVANVAGSTLYKTRFNGKSLYTVTAAGAVTHHLNNNEIVYEVKDGETLYYVRQGNKINKVEYQVQGGRYVTPTPETGQDTVEVLVGSSSVQLTVTANAGVNCAADHVWIRFLDMAGNVIGTDVDECPTCRGAAGLDVQGLSSGQKLPLHRQSEAMNSAKALMYDQYDVLNPGGLTPPYLAGDVDLYAQGKFRVQNPCGTANDGFYVEVFEQKDINRQELQNGWHREMIDCVPPLQPGANELKVSFDTADVTAANTGTAVVTWEAIDNAVEYTVAVINTTNPARYTIHGTPAMVRVAAGDPEAGRTARFPGIRSGTRYIFAVYAEVTGGGYSALRFVILTPEFVAN